MTAAIDYFYTPISGYAYLGEPRLMEIARTAGARVRFRPMDIAAVFKASGTTPPAAQSPARLAYRLADLAREAKRAGLPITPKPKHWPVPSAPAGQLILAAEADGIDPHRVSFALLKAIYAEERDISDRTTLAAILTDLGLDADRLIARSETPEIEAAFAANTEAAIAAGVFGSPTYVVGEEMFFGQDRLDALAWHLSQSTMAA
ncbi:2-hydroxychromene-2-carboxylate isomerase [Amorphus orientalis]|uniref:2-hydroxychromene-2-carboxylate isomerase n=1 Tax=Amorphus orientalis TaxID=649198 RepID=A0AAE3VPF9_9HYPH|nr:2-hydroxychromene-2-carboxylate isomerase [Amorphus orientalis]MDQ0315755.1 2-hydroxychromene-2-carboxylate isomerase [Amorphus orientalis]